MEAWRRQPRPIAPPAPRTATGAAAVRRALPLLRRLLCLALAGGAFAAAAGQPAPPDYHRARWTTADGAPLQITSMAQTSDGWLWLGSYDGLYRFDGVRFARYPLPARAGLTRNMIIELHAGSKGELYIAHAAEGMSVLYPDGRLQALPHPPSPRPVHALAVDVDGSLWAMSDRIDHFADGRWRTVSDHPAWARAEHSGFMLDRRGRLWASNEAAVWRLDRGAGRFERVLEVGGELAPAPDGRLWLVSDNGDVKLVDDAGGESGAAGDLPRPGQADGRDNAQFAPDGALWVLRCPERSCVVQGAAQRQGRRYSAVKEAAARLDPASDMSGPGGRAILVDREGDVWISTENGLDRFRRNRFRSAGLPGPGSDYSLATDAQGRVWAANRHSGRLWELRPDRPPLPQPGRRATVLARSPAGALLLGGKRGIQRRGGAGVEDIPLPPGRDGKPFDQHMLGILDDGKILWTATAEMGLLAWRDGAWLARAAFPLPPRIYLSGPAGVGQFWFVTGDSKLFLHDAARGLGPAVDVRALGLPTAIFHGDPLTLSGDAGTGIVRDGVLRMLQAAEPNVLRNVSGLVVTPDGDRWFNGAAGLIHVRAADWRRSVDQPDLPLRYELFDGEDGYPGRAVFERRWPSAVSGDGRNLWLAATGGVVRLDLATLARNPVTLNPTILALATEDAVFEPDRPVRLPPGSANFRIQFTAPALRKPERLRFEYRLDGFDQQWLDAGTRRATSYTNIAPGSYVFRVRAVDEDGVTRSTEASLPLSVEPAPTQTLWFKLACALGLVLLAIALYRYRVRYLTLRLTERLQVKTAERERIARTLHDTFLQTVQGLVLRVDAVAAALPEHDRTRQQLEHVLDDASTAIGEGRDRLQELRAGDARVLEDLLGDAVARLRASRDANGGSAAIELRVEGERRRLLAPVADEIADIAREALRNAVAHAGAGEIRVTLGYERRRLTLAVSDDGKGVDRAILSKGFRSGHWGLVCMRERAERIGARLSIDSAPRRGTAISLVVPAARAYFAERVAE